MAKKKAKAQSASKSPAATGSVTDYLKALPEDRRRALQAVRKAIQAALPDGYRETMQYGMISYVVPLKLYPQGYLGKPDVPLPFVSLASQKNHMAVYLMCVYGADEAQFRKAYQATGKKLDMGKSCVRFKKLEDLALDVIAAAIRDMPVSQYIEQYESARRK